MELLINETVIGTRQTYERKWAARNSTLSNYLNKQINTANQPNNHMRFQVLKVQSTKKVVLWNVGPVIIVKTDRRFRGVALPTT